MEMLEEIKQILEDNKIPASEKQEKILELTIRKNRNARVTKGVIDRMHELREKGKSYDDIRHVLGISLSTVRYHLVPGTKNKIKDLNRRCRQKMKDNPEVYKAYIEYQKDYQKKMRVRKKLLEVTQPKDIQEKSNYTLEVG